MKKQKKKLIIIISIFAVLIIVSALVLILNNSSKYIDDDESEFADYDDNLNEEPNLVLDVSESEIAEYTKVNYKIELTYDSSDAVYVDLNEISKSYKITSAGTYILSGTLNGQIIVNSEDEESVKIVLNGAEISSSKNSPIVIEAAEETIIFLADGTTNYITDTDNYEDPDEKEDATPAAIFSRDDLYISGSGKLIIESENKCGIQGKDQIVIHSGTITIDAAKEAIKAKDYLIIENGNLDLTAGEDGISVTEDEEEDKGYIVINGGSIKVNSQYDGISAKTYLIINGGNIDITTLTSDTSKSSKGIKSDYYLEINSGTISINSKDDGLHSGSEININNGDITISSGDDGIHADELVEINNGKISIKKSYEGIEGKNIYINSGEISIASSDDGINIADSSSTNSGMGGMMSVLNNAALYINGGEIYVNTNGDGLDSNGDMYITGGKITVDGPTNNGNGGLDCNGELIVDGGFLVVAGSSGMAEAPDQTSGQNSVIIGFENTMSAGTLISIESSNGDELVSYTPIKTFQAFVFSSEDLETGETYEIFVNQESYKEFTISSTTTTLGTVGGMGMGGRMQPPTGGMARQGRW